MTMTPAELAAQEPTLELLNNEAAARLSRQSESLAKIDTKAVFLVGFAATADAATSVQVTPVVWAWSGLWHPRCGRFAHVPGWSEWEGGWAVRTLPGIGARSLVLRVGRGRCAGPPTVRRPGAGGRSGRAQSV